MIVSAGFLVVLTEILCHATRHGARGIISYRREFIGATIPVELELWL